MLRRFVPFALILALAAALALTVAGATDRSTPTERTVAASPTEASAPHYTADEMALLVLQEEGVARVRALSEELRATSDPARRAELQKQVVQIKQETRLRFLETLAAQAYERGDAEEYAAARAEIERLENPPRPAAVPHPVRPVKETQEGGQP
jgi:lipopolysaccharide export system protein LptC